MVLRSQNIFNQVRQLEISLVSKWNRRGEPWAIINPESGETLKKGPGGLIWTWLDSGWHEDDVTEYFNDFTEKDFGVSCFSDISYSVLCNKLDDLEECGSLDRAQTHLRDVLQKLYSNSSGGSLRLSTVGLPLSLVRNNIVTHFHPDDISFSKRDFIALMNNPLEMRVFGCKNVFVLRNVASRIPSSKLEEVTQGYTSKHRDSFWHEKAKEYGFYYGCSLA